MPKRSRSASICDGLRNTCFVHIGRGFLPLLAVMLLAAPQLAMAQGSLAVTVDPRTLPITEAEGTTVDGEYTVVLDTEPSENVTIMVMGAPTADADITVSSDTLMFAAPSEPGGDNGTWDDEQTVRVTVRDDANAVSETVTLTHTATIGDDEDTIALSNASVRVTVRDTDTRGVTVSEATTPAEVPEAGMAIYTVVLDTEPTDMVTVDVRGVSGELAVSPSRLFFMPGDGNWDTVQTVTVYAGEDLDAENDTATLTHTVRGGDYTGVAAATVSVVVDDNDTRGVTVSDGRAQPRCRRERDLFHRPEFSADEHGEDQGDENGGSFQRQPLQLEFLIEHLLIENLLIERLEPSTDGDGLFPIPFRYHE